MKRNDCAKNCSDCARNGVNFMCRKTIIMNEKGQEFFQYSEGIPIVRLKNSLDNYRNGEMAHHWHSEFQFGLMLTGELEYCLFRDPVSKVSQVIRPGDGFFINSRVLHGCRQMVPGTEIFTFGIPSSFFAALNFGSIYQKMVLPVLHSPVFGFFLSAGNKKDESMLKLFREFKALTPGKGDYELHSLELICGIWRDLFRRLGCRTGLSSFGIAEMEQTERIQGMLNFIHQHYQEPITVDQIAGAGGVSRRECFRCFRMVINQSPVEYLNQYRLSVAAYLLANTDQGLAQICESCGFGNISYFARLFKKRYGTSPGQFRG
ncbi:MAG TPA: helix-turn-helix transcriptional regulator [Candidatus Cottocaccamicrobium excrementipullorum]|nr:helix-turn-helix transcriptional regulator [Candidatus Cottocaccamicrobium excrementipullorum]